MDHSGIINSNSAVMVEQVLLELIENFNKMVESLHERNLKREAQLETLTRELSLEREQRRELEAKLSAYQNGTSQIAEGMKAQVQAQQHPPPQQQQQQQPQLDTTLIGKSDLQQAQPTPSTTATTLIPTLSNLQPINQQQIHQQQQQQQQHGSNNVTADGHLMQQQHHQHHLLSQQQPQHPQSQVLYQQIPASTQVFPPQQTQYIWTYDTSTSNGTGQMSYYDHYAASAPAFAQQQQ